MKKILTVSLFAIMAVGAANADIASTQYVDGLTGSATFTAGSSIASSADLTAAVNVLAGKVDTVVGSGTGSVADQISNALSSAEASAFSESVQGSLTKADNAVQNSVYTQDKNKLNEDIVAAKKAGDDASDALDAYKIEANNTFMDSTEVSSAIVSAVTGDNGALKNYTTTEDMNTALSKKEDQSNKVTGDTYTTGSATQYPSIKTAETIAARAVNASMGGLGDLAYLDTVDTAHIDDVAVTTVKIADVAVTNAKIADVAVTNGKLAADAVTNAKLADNAVQTENIKDGEVKTADIADLAVTTGKLVDKAVTNDKVSDAINASLKLADSAMQETALKALSSWKTADYDCSAEGTTCSLVSKNGAIAWEKVSY